MTQSLPSDQDQPRQHFIGEVIGTQPAVKRVSRRVAFRGYRVFFVKAIKENGEIETGEVFKPVRQYDRSVLSSSKYMPHQGERERVRRIRQACRLGMTPKLDINL